MKRREFIACWAARRILLNWPNPSCKKAALDLVARANGSQSCYIRSLLPSPAMVDTDGVFPGD
jgi:hypothetical protein